MKDIFEIGIVTGVHGIRGDLKVFPYTNDPKNLSKSEYFIIDGVKREVQAARVQGKFLIVKIRGIDSRESGLEMKGTILSLPREFAAPLEEGLYYMEDLIGCDVFEDSTWLGRLDDIMETGANDVYSIVNDKGREILVPAIKDVIKSIDIEKRRIDVILLDGLLEDEYI